MTLAGDFDAGDYTITLTDAYGDGWMYTSAGGVDLPASGEPRIHEQLFSSGSFTVVPQLAWLFWASQACPAAVAIEAPLPTEASLHKTLGVMAAHFGQPRCSFCHPEGVRIDWLSQNVLLS